MSYINIIKRSYPLVLIACNALKVEPSKIFPEHRFFVGSTNRQEFLHDLAEASPSPRWEISDCTLSTATAA
jgi:hypothetical protein